MPLKRAYALTIHKAQGLTTGLTQVDLMDQFVRNPAMVYVAVSRARNPEELTIVAVDGMLEQLCNMDNACKEWV